MPASESPEYRRLHDELAQAQADADAQLEEAQRRHSHRRPPRFQSDPRRWVLKWVALPVTTAVLLLVGAVEFGPALAAAEGHGTAGYFVAEVEHCSKGSCGWTGNFVGPDGRMTLRNVGFMGPHGTLHQGDKLAALDTGPGPDVITPAGIRVQDSARAAGLRAFLTSRRWLITLAGTAGCWFLLYYAYYGNTISTPQILGLIAPNASTMTKIALQLAIFVVAAVPGYILAIARLDKIGHRKLQIIGFAMMALCFLIIGAVPGMTTMVATFLIVYGVSYFFTEFGPNMTTYVLPSELYPVSMRTTGHGISAGVGKLGAFIGVFLFPVLQTSLGLRGTILLTAGMAIFGFALTFVLPEPAGLSLDQITRSRADEPIRAAVLPDTALAS